jgi:polyisoprenoid-binding protein YceI
VTSPRPASADPADAPAAGTWRLDPERTSVRADVRAMFGLLTVRGKFRLIAGDVTIAEDPARSTVQAAIDAGSYASGNAKRDSDVTSAGLLDTAAHPEITFNAGQARQEAESWVVPGSLCVHGTTHPVDVQVTGARMEDGNARFTAVAHLDRTDFGITKKKGMVGRTVHVTIDAVGTPA